MALIHIETTSEVWPQLEIGSDTVPEQWIRSGSRESGQLNEIKLQYLSLMKKLHFLSRHRLDMALETLPIDIITNILVSLPDLTTLQKTIVSSRSIYNVFRCRRSVFLDKVYEIQVIRSFQMTIEENPNVLRTDPEYWDLFEKDIKRMRGTCQKATLSSRDALALQLSAWKAMQSFDVPIWHSMEFGQSLLTLCEAKSRPEILLEIVEDVHQTILKTDRPAISAYDMRKHGQRIDRFMCRLAKVYCDTGRTPKAIELLYTYLLSQDFPSDVPSILALLKLMKKNPGTTYENRLLGHLSSRFIRNRNTHPNVRNRHRISGTYAMDAYLHFIYLELNKLDDATSSLQRSVHLLSAHPTDLARVISMARRIIKALKASHQNEQVLAVRRLVYDAMYTIGLSRVEVSTYSAWAKNYAADARFFGLPQIAITVEEQMVIGLLSSLNESPESARYLAAARALLKAYDDAGTPQQLRLQQVQQFSHEGYADREDEGFPQYLKANMEVPIMT